MKKYGLLLLILSGSHLCQAASGDQEGYRRIMALLNSVKGAPLDLFVQIKQEQGPGFMVKVPGGATYADLKLAIEMKTGISSLYQTLSRNGVELSDYATVSPLLTKSPLLTIDPSQQRYALR